MVTSVTAVAATTTTAAAPIAGHRMPGGATIAATRIVPPIRLAISSTETLEPAM
jgi:hypothetical protein